MVSLGFLIADLTSHGALSLLRFTINIQVGKGFWLCQRCLTSGNLRVSTIHWDRSAHTARSGCQKHIQIVVVFLVQAVLVLFDWDVFDACQKIGRFAFGPGAGRRSSLLLLFLVKWNLKLTKVCNAVFFVANLKEQFI